MIKEDEVMATVSASFTRRWMGVGALYAMGAFLMYLALTGSPAFGWRVFLIVFGFGSMWLADTMRRATGHVIELTREELRDSSGVVLARVDDIAKVDRGIFAFKPSNGFLIKLSTRTAGRVWRPGLWWRLGRQIGIGGVAPGYQTKFMSEMLAAMLAERDETADT